MDEACSISNKNTVTSMKHHDILNTLNTQFDRFSLKASTLINSMSCSCVQKYKVW